MKHIDRRRATLGVTIAAGLLATTACTGTPTTGRPCTDVELVVARGTGEPGALGLIVGDPLLAATRTAIAPKTIAGHPIVYPATLAAGSPQTGNRAVVAHISTRSAQCATTKFVLVGYSQGAQVVDMAVGADVSGTINVTAPVAVIPADLAPRITAIVTFGNPISALGRALPAPYADRHLDVCAQGDPVCQAGGGNFGAHLTYSADAGRGAAFIRSRVS
jgi:cutinase